MTILTFQPRFAELVRSGQKRQTIRPVRKRPIKVGDELSLRMWTGKPYRSRQEILGSGIVTFYDMVQLSPNRQLVFVAGFQHNADDIARADGFSSVNEMFAWLDLNHGPGLFNGVIIRW